MARRPSQALPLSPGPSRSKETARTCAWKAPAGDLWALLLFCSDAHEIELLSIRRTTKCAQRNFFEIYPCILRANGALLSGRVKRWPKRWVWLSWQSAGLWPRRSRVRVPSPTPFGALTSEYGPVAQLVEQGTLNPKVQGSNPCRSTMNFQPPYREVFSCRNGSHGFEPERAQRPSGALRAEP